MSFWLGIRVNVIKKCWDDNKGGGGLIQSCAPRQDVRRWSTFVATRCTEVSPERCAYARREGRPSRQDGRRLTRDPGTIGEAQRAREVGREGTHDTRQTTAVCVDTAIGGAESCAVGDRNGSNVKRKGCGAGGCAESVFFLHEGEYSLNCRQKITRQAMNTCGGLLQYSLYGTRDAAPHWEEELTSTLSDLNLRGRRPMRVARAHKRASTSWRPCTETTSRLVVNDRQWKFSSASYRDNTRSRSK